MRTIPRFPWPTRALLLVGLAAMVAGCSAPLVRNQGADSTWSATQKPSWTLVPPSREAPTSKTSPPEISFQRGPATDPEFDRNYPRVDEFLEIFRTEKRAFFQRALERSGKYLPRMTRIMEEEGLPPELAYLPLIESGFHTGAVSRAGAVGPWQFIRGTGRRYGLRIDQYVDERRDPLKSTRAAAHYLRDLYEMFGSWHLSLAAYNTGEERIARIKDRQGAETFWEMTERGYLHPETDDYVPQFLAALQIARAPREHGFDAPSSDPIEYDLVKIDRSLSLQRLAKMAGVEPREVLELNPALVRGVTPPDRSGYKLRVPRGTKEQFAVAYERLLRDLSSVVARAETGRETTYRVRRGDTPAAIAKRFGVSVAALMRANGWKNATRIRAGATIRIPAAIARAAGDRQPLPAHAAKSPPPARPTALQAWMDSEVPGPAAFRTAAASTALAPVSRPGTPITYRVRAGDTLSLLSARYGVDVKTLADLNGLRDPKSLRPGMLLRIPATSHPAAALSKSNGAPSGAPSSAARSCRRTQTYRIRKGDSPTSIAKRFGVPVATLIAHNGWSDPRKLRPGETVEIPGDCEGEVRLAYRPNKRTAGVN